MCFTPDPVYSQDAQQPHRGWTLLLSLGRGKEGTEETQQGNSLPGALYTLKL